MIALLATLALAGETPLVTAGSSWRYLDTGVAPASDWKSLAYDDSSWLVGPAPLGYGLADIVTAVDYGGDPVNRYVTTWFRQEFDAATVNGFDAFSLHLRRDDGAIVYLNGTEVLRHNLPLAGVTPTTLATRSVFGVEQDTFFDLALAPGLIVAGDNVVAVEVHQQSVASFDLVMDLKVSAWDGPTDVTRGPWLQSLTPEGAVVRWRTDGPSAGRLWWGPTVGALTETRDDPVLGFQHELTITGVTPRTEVVYAVGSPAGVVEGDDVDHVFRTAPVPGVARPVRIWALGDSGTANVSAEGVRDAYMASTPDPLDTDVWLMLGDNAYGSGTESEYQKAVFDFYPEWLRQVPLWSTLGNHDGYSAFSDTQTGPYFDLFTFPTNGESGGVPSGTEAYYSFDYANIHFVSLDSMHSDRSTTGAMATWMLADLASVDSDWLIAFWHHPPYSHGSHNSDFEDELVEMRENFVPMLEDAGVDLVLSGHSHSYERSWLIDGHYGTSSTFDPVAMTVQDQDGNRQGGGAYTKWTASQEPHQGAVYVVAGSSGQISGGSLDHQAMVVSLNALGSMVLDVDGLSLDARFMDETGTVVDQFAIDKGKTTIVSIDGPRIGMENEVLAFDGYARQPDGLEPPTYAWDWGDGSADVVANPASHGWATEGTYNVTLTVTDTDGLDTSDTFEVNVDNAPPVIDQLEATVGAVEGSPVTFTSLASDPAGDPLTYSWEIDGDVLDGNIVAHTFYDNGAFEATLTVTDDAGRVATGVLFVPVANADPIVDQVTITEAFEGAATTVLAQVHDPGWEDPLTYTWILPDGTGATGSVLSHSFPDDGVYPVTLTVVDDDEGFVQEIVDLQIENLDPVVVDPSFAGALQEGGVVTFHATASDPGPLDVPVVRWGFESVTEWVDGEDVAHVFPDQGPWVVWIAAEDEDGGLAFDSLDVTLQNLPASIVRLEVPETVGEGVESTFAVTVTDPGTADVITADWTFSDGGTAQGLSVVHTFPKEGPWTGTVDVKDDEGEGESADFGGVATNVPPAFRSEPEGRVWPGGGYAYQPEVEDVDPVTFELAMAPDGASLGADGRVLWPVAPREIGVVSTFELVASDPDGGQARQRWTVVVSEEAVAPDRLTRTDALGCGCGTTGGPAFGWVLVGLVGLRRRSAR